MSSRDRYRKPARRDPFRDPRPRVLIFCEGEVTEKRYLEGLADHHRNSRIKVQVAEETGVPFSLVEFAKKRKHEIEVQADRQGDQNIAYDSVWCVFDVDEHPRIPEAKVMADANGIKLAISNPCFELWLILHFRDNPGAQHRHDLQSLLATLDPAYSKKAKRVDFSQYAPGYEQAVKRAMQLDCLADSIGSPGHNPTTNVYELTELILKGSDQQ